MSVHWNNLYRSPFFWLLGILVVLELFAHLGLPYSQQPQAGEVARNPRIWRGWPEYLIGPKAAQQKTAVIISNSQGVGREMKDANDIYIAGLKSKVRAQGLPLQIENWSLEGIRLAEIEMLTLQAVKRRVDLVVVIISPMNLDRGKQFNLDFGPSDVDLIAGDPTLWPLLKDSGIMRNTSFHDVLKRSALLYSSLVRSRIAVHDVLAAKLDPRLDRYLFGQRKNRNAHLRIDEMPKRHPRLPSHRQSMGAQQWEQLLRVVRRPAFDSLYENLAIRLKTHNIKLLWAWMPLPHEQPGAAAVRGVQAFHRDVCRTIHADGFVCVDFSTTIPDQYFLPLFHWTHLSKEGHRKFADTLYPILVDAVH